LYSPYYGALTELYGACSPELDQANQGCYIIPWGRVGLMRKDVHDEMMAGEGGNAAKFWQYCEDQCKDY